MVGQPGLSSMNFNFWNVIFQPVVFRFVWVKQKWKFISDCCQLSFSSPTPGFAAHSCICSPLEMERLHCVRHYNIAEYMWFCQVKYVCSVALIISYPFYPLFWLKALIGCFHSSYWVTCIYLFSSGHGNHTEDYPCWHLWLLPEKQDASKGAWGASTCQ